MSDTLEFFITARTQEYQQFLKKSFLKEINTLDFHLMFNSFVLLNRLLLLHIVSNDKNE